MVARAQGIRLCDMLYATCITRHAATHTKGMSKVACYVWHAACSLRSCTQHAAHAKRCKCVNPLATVLVAWDGTGLARSCSPHSTACAFAAHRLVVCVSCLAIPQASAWHQLVASVSCLTAPRWFSQCTASAASRVAAAQAAAVCQRKQDMSNSKKALNH